MSFLIHIVLNTLLPICTSPTFNHLNALDIFFVISLNKQYLYLNCAPYFIVHIFLSCALQFRWVSDFCVLHMSHYASYTTSCVVSRTPWNRWLAHQNVFTHWPAYHVTFLELLIDWDFRLYSKHRLYCCVLSTFCHMKN